MVTGAPFTAGSTGALAIKQAGILAISSLWPRTCTGQTPKIVSAAGLLFLHFLLTIENEAQWPTSSDVHR